ncbi:MAG: flavodoxin-dependent (E)-4-hydroxy-3-methylbut-2-enyl-diphosphate synthase [Candidatus Goldiibacteriota bacterium]
MKRIKTRTVKIGGLSIGGTNPVAVQSMTNTATKNTEKTIQQIKRLEHAGCELIRCSVPDKVSAEALKKIVSKARVPVAADIHFDHNLALAALENGADKIRINPGNIGGRGKVKNVIDAAKMHKAAIRIGVNAGSLKKDPDYKLGVKSGNKTADLMVAGLMEHIVFFEKNRFKKIVVSLKASDIITTVDACRLFLKYRNYPLHIGITESGTEFSGAIKSAAGIAVLLYEGIGDTVRVSLTADPVKEIFTAYKILGSMGVRKRGAEIISCPTCARTSINVIKLARDVEKLTEDVKKPVKIAVMGCPVNGPGEAKDADIGITGAGKTGIIIKDGKVIKRTAKKELLKVFMKELDRVLKKK